MSRVYIQPSWVDSCSNHLEWSGQSPNDRKRKSHMIGGKANLSAYDEPEQKKKAVNKKSAFEQADLANRHYERLEKISCDLDAELDRGEITAGQWAMARKQLDKRLDLAWKRVADANGWDAQEKDQELYSLCLSEMQDKHKQKRTQKPVDNQQEQGLSFSHELIDSLSEENFFKLPLKKLLTAKEKMVKILEILKS